MPASTDELWERFARKRALYYILTEDEFRRGDADLDRLFSLGERDAARIVHEAQPWLRRFDAAIEIGCGVGRLSIPMASRFRSVVAIDVSPTMLAKCADNCATRGVANVVPIHAAEASAGAFEADFVFSFIVLQHVEDLATIHRYLALTRSWLREDGVASLQFDTRPVSLPYRLRNRVPDVLLPRSWRRGIRRIRRSRSEVLAATQRAGLTVVREIAPESPRHVLIATRTGAHAR